MSDILPEDPVERLNLLTERQLEILKEVCHCSDYKQVAKNLFITENTVKSTMHQIYIKLGIVKIDWLERRRIIFEEICERIAAGDVTPAPTEEPQILLPVPVQIEQMVDEDEKAIIAWRSKKLVPIPPPDEIIATFPPTRSWRTSLAFLSGLLVMFLVLYIGGFLGGRDGTSALPSGMPLTPAETISGLAPTSTLEGNQPSQTAIVQEPTLDVLGTSPATHTPTATIPPTPFSIDELYVQNLPLPVEAGTVLLEDDFSIQNAWEIDWGQYDGERILLADPAEDHSYFSHARPFLQFDNFILEFDAYWTGGPIGGKYGVAFRFQDQDNNYEYLIGNDGRYVISKYVNGKQTIFLEGFSDAIGRSGDANRFHIEANDTTLRFFINNTYLGTIEDSDFSIGDIAFLALTPVFETLFIGFDNLILAMHP